MNREQILQSIEDLRNAGTLIHNCSGMSYDKACHASEIIGKERMKFEKRLKELDKKEGVQV